MKARLLAAMKDGASVNQAAVQQVSFFFPQLLDVNCFSCITDNVRKHFEFMSFINLRNTGSVCSDKPPLYVLHGRQGLASQCESVAQHDGGANRRSWSVLKT